MHACIDPYPGTDLSLIVIEDVGFFGFIKISLEAEPWLCWLMMNAALHCLWVVRCPYINKDIYALLDASSY
jgi:hypothetical protein